MKSLIIPFVVIGFIFTFSSCESCVKQTAKKVTEMGISAVEGVAEALDEGGEKLAERTTDVAGKILVGVGKSLDRQLNEHAEKMAESKENTSMQVIDGMKDGMDETVKALYNEIPFTGENTPGVEILYIGKYQSVAVVDIYCSVSEKGAYQATFQCYNQQDELLLTKKIDFDFNSEPDSNLYVLLSFSLNSTEEAAFKDIKHISSTITKR